MANEFYSKLALQLTALTEGVDEWISNLANASALIYDSLEGLNWAGFYLARDNKELVLGPFQGKIACTKIPFSRGVCGKCAREQRVIRVDNVHEFEGHIACDSASNSEIVLPVMKNGALFALLDIDSPLFSRFTQADEEGLAELVRVIEKSI